MTMVTEARKWRVGLFVAPAEGLPPTWRCMLQLWGCTLAASWVSRRIAPYVDVVFSYQLGRSCSLLATLLNFSYLLSKLDSNRSEETKRQWLRFSILYPTVDYFVFKNYNHNILPHYTSHREFLLVNHFGIQGIVLTYARWKDQQISDILGCYEIFTTVVQVLVFWNATTAVSGIVIMVVPLATMLMPNFMVFIIETTGCPFLTDLAVWSTRLIFKSLLACEMVYRSIYRWLNIPVVQARNLLFKVQPGQVSNVLEYEYRHLQYRHVRLLKLSKQRLLGGPRCELISLPLDEAPLYEAVSHRWENPMTYQSIIVNHSQHLKVSSRIYDFLCHRSSYLCSRYVWIDSICICQDDLDEREEQVKIMGDIFCKAIQVVVWLGSREEAPSSNLVLDHLIWTEFLCSRGLDFWLLDRVAAPSDKSTMQKALRKLLSNSWFTRIWIVQEVALAERVLILYGSTCLEWWQLEQYASMLRNDRYPTAYHGRLGAGDDEALAAGIRTLEQIQSISNIRKQVQQDSKAVQFAALKDTGLTTETYTTPSATQRHQKLAHYKVLYFPSALKSTVLFNATDPRDRIFALLGMIRSPEANLPTPNYRSSFEDVYLQTAKLVLQSEPYGASLLTRAGVGLHKFGVAHALRPLPSWTPDLLSHESLAGVVANLTFEHSRTKIKTEGKSNVIKPHAAFVDRLQSLGPVSKSSVFRTMEDSSRSNSSMEVVVRELCSWVLATKSYVQSECKHQLTSNFGLIKTQEESFWRTIFTNKFADRSPFPPEDALMFKRLETTCRRAIAKTDETSKADVAEGWPVMDGDYIREGMSDIETTRSLSSLELTSLGRRFGITEQGRFAMVPPLSRQGDMICVIEDLEEPFLVRVVDDQYHQLVGACYVDELAISSEVQQSLFQDIFLV